MTAKPLFTLGSLEGMSQFAPLIALGFACRNQDVWSPICSRLKFPSGMHTEHPQNALMTLWISMLAGCRSVSQINTCIRPDRVLAHAWGQACFAEQSVVARILDQTQSEQVVQLRDGIEHIYSWIGQASMHDWNTPFLVDIDLTGLPISARAEGSTKGYFSEKKALSGVSCAGSPLLSMMKASVRCYMLAIH